MAPKYFKNTALTTFALLLPLSLNACGATDGTSHTKTAETTAQSVTPPAAPSADITQAISGTYIGDPTHTYVGLTYMHQGYARATLRVDNVAIKLDLDASAPESANLVVDMKTENISTGTKSFDQHLMSADFFDRANYPNMQFKSTSMTLTTPATGTVTGDLTLKGITKPVTLDVRLNKIGQNFRSKADMIGISATGNIKRSDWDLGKYTPVVGDDVSLVIEAEMAIKAE